MRHSNAKLLILHVLESVPSIHHNYVKHYRTGDEILGDEAYQEEVKEKIYKICTADLAAPDRLEVRIAFGFPWVEIVKWAREESVDLIVLGAHTAETENGEKMEPGGKVGSTADGVIKHARCPVMIASKPIAESMMAFKKVIVSIDSIRSRAFFAAAPKFRQKMIGAVFFRQVLPEWCEGLLLHWIRLHAGVKPFNLRLG